MAELVEGGRLEIV